MFDLIIIGGSAAATSAGIYAARRGLNFKIITNQFKEHLKFYNVVPEEGVEVDKIAKQPDGTFLITAPKDGSAKIEYKARAVIVATGVHPRELNVPGEKEFRNKGVSYCTVCDGP